MILSINEKFANNPLVIDAAVFAHEAHTAINHVRKYTGEPYTVHLHEVANLVSHCEDATGEMVAAAFLHDVVEDTDVTQEQVAARFEDPIASYVDLLTDKSRPADGNRETRKRLDRERLAIAPGEVQTIKLADLISNTLSIVKHDPNFATVYLAEKSLLLEVLTDGDIYLRKVAYRLLARSQKKLVQAHLMKLNTGARYGR